jgi:hypothetical protein
LHTQAFDGVGMADCIKRGVYDTWGVTLRTAYPAWSSLSVCVNVTPAPTAAPSTATPSWRSTATPSTSRYVDR